MTQPFTHKDYEIVKREILYQGVFCYVRLHVRHKLYGGGWSDVFTREVLERKPAAATLPHDPKLDRIILIEQFRCGMIDGKTVPWQIEIPAGIIDPNETPEQVAIRETKEEAGCEISNLQLIAEHYLSPGASTEYIHVYYGHVDASHINGIHGLKHENEDIRVLNLTADEALAKLHNNEIKNPPAIIALQWFELNRDRLRKA